MPNSTDGDPATELLDVVSLRHDMLSCLSETPHEQPTLVDRLDSSKATVYRGVRELEEADLIAHGPDGYTLTAAGAALLAAYEEFRGVAETAAEASELLYTLPNDADVSPAFLRGAEAIAGSSPATYEAGARIASLIDDSTRTRGLAKAHTQSEAVDVHYRSIVEQGTDTAFVLDPEMAEHIRTLDDPKVAAAAASEHFTVHGTAELPFGLFICEAADGVERALLAIYDADGLLRGVLINDSEPALSWAEETYERYRRQAVEGS